MPWSMALPEGAHWNLRPKLFKIIEAYLSGLSDESVDFISALETVETACEVRLALSSPWYLAAV